MSSLTQYLLFQSFSINLIGFYHLLSSELANHSLS